MKYVSICKNSFMVRIRGYEQYFARWFLIDGEKTIETLTPSYS